MQGKALTFHIIQDADSIISLNSVNSLKVLHTHRGMHKLLNDV